MKCGNPDTRGRHSRYQRMKETNPGALLLRGYRKNILLLLFVLGLVSVTAGCEKITIIAEQLDSLRGVNTEDLKVWVRKDSHRDKLIVFVHGFNSTNEAAWGKFPSLLKDDDRFKDFNIVLFGYPAKLCSSVNSIHLEGDVLASFLNDTFRSISPVYNRFVLVGHSMGGLVIMHALLNLERDHFEALNAKDLRFMTFGSPYMGVENTDLLPPFCKSRQTEDMQVLNGGLHELALNWNRRFNLAEEDSGRPTPKIRHYTYWAREDRFIKKASACGYAKIPCEAVDGDHYSIVKPETREHSAYTKVQFVSLQPQQSVPLELRELTPDIVVQGVMPLHLRAQIVGPDNVRYVEQSLGFIMKVFNPSSIPRAIETFTLEGCAKIDPWFAREAFIDRGLLPKQLNFGDKNLADLASTAVQKIRTTGAVRSDTRVLPPEGIGYVGVLLPLPLGKSGAMMLVEDSASLRGECSKIPRPTSQPSITQLLSIGVISYREPNDIAEGFRDGSLKINLHVNGKAITIESRLLGKLYSIQWKTWRSLDLARMYEVPETDYPPTLDAEN